MQASRRAFLNSAALSGVAFALAACGAVNPNQNGQQNLAQVVTDVTDIAAAFKNVLPQITSLPQVTPAIRQTIATDIGEMQTVAAALVNAATTTAASPLVQQIETDVNAVVAALATIPLPPAISGVLQAATVLLPVIEAAIGMIVAAPAKAKAAGAEMTPMQARAILRTTAGH